MMPSCPLDPAFCSTYSIFFCATMKQGPGGRGKTYQVSTCAGRAPVSPCTQHQACRSNQEASAVAWCHSTSGMAPTTKAVSAAAHLCCLEACGGALNLCVQLIQQLALQQGPGRTSAEGHTRARLAAAQARRGHRARHAGRWLQYSKQALQAAACILPALPFPRSTPQMPPTGCSLPATGPHMASACTCTAHARPFSTQHSMIARTCRCSSLRTHCSIPSPSAAQHLTARTCMCSSCPISLPSSPIRTTWWLSWSKSSSCRLRTPQVACFQE